MSDRQWRVRPEQDGWTVGALLREVLGAPWSQIKRYLATGKVFVDDAPVTRGSAVVRAGQSVALQMNAPRPRDPNAQVWIVYDDAHVVIIDKPAGVSSVPYADRETGTAMDLLREAWRRKRGDGRRVPLHVVHRIDKATSGLLMFAKTKSAERGLAAQLRAHTMERRYLCVAHGDVHPGRIESQLVRDRGDGLRGSTRHPGQGKRAVTHVEVVQRLRDATLCRIRLETGKTHQIRIHLAERGHPLVGEAVYIRDYAARAEPIASSRLLLHAETLGFEHPRTGRWVFRASKLPDDFATVLTRLGGSAPPMERGKRGERDEPGERRETRKPGDKRTRGGPRKRSGRGER